MDTWILGYMDTWIHGYMDTWMHGYMDLFCGHMYFFILTLLFILILITIF
jgi:hypothetical protein